MFSLGWSEITIIVVLLIVIVGPNEMMDQNGYLLWDTPSNYGYLNHVFIYLIPIENYWLSFYYLNSLLTFIFSIIINVFQT